MEARPVLLLVWALLAACSSDAARPLADSQLPSATTECVEADRNAETLAPAGVLVDGADVRIGTRLSEPEEAVIRWALDRFDLADLQLPTEIDVSFRSNRDACHGATALCHPAVARPSIVICAPVGPLFAQVLAARIAVLHELAHIWHWSQGDGDRWPDDRAIVGGELGDGGLWEDRMHERVAVAISWGLLDQPRRPVRTDLTCRELHEQFEGLTGRRPLEPIEDVCRP